MENLISKVTGACFYRLRRPHHIRSYVSQKVMAQFVMSLVISRLHDCAGVHACILVPLQRVQNAAGRRSYIIQ